MLCNSDHYNVYLKGAPETIANICDPITGKSIKLYSGYLILSYWLIDL